MNPNTSVPDAGLEAFADALSPAHLIPHASGDQVLAVAMLAIAGLAGLVFLVVEAVAGALGAPGRGLVS